MITVNKKEFFDIIKKSNTVINKKKNINHFQGIHFNFTKNIKDNILNIVATDGIKLTIYKIKYTNNIKMNNFYIHYNQILALLKEVKYINRIKNDDTIDIYVDDDNVIIKDNDKEYKLKYVIHDFNYCQITPYENKVNYFSQRLDKKEFEITLYNNEMIELQNKLKSIIKQHKNKKEYKKVLMTFINKKLILTFKKDDYSNDNIINETIHIKNSIRYSIFIYSDNILNMLNLFIDKDNKNKITIKIYKDNSIFKIDNKGNEYVTLMLGKDNTESKYDLKDIKEEAQKYIIKTIPTERKKIENIDFNNLQNKQAKKIFNKIIKMRFAKQLFNNMYKDKTYKEKIKLFLSIIKNNKDTYFLYDFYKHNENKINRYILKKYKLMNLKYLSDHQCMMMILKELSEKMNNMYI